MRPNNVFFLSSFLIALGYLQPPPERTYHLGADAGHSFFLFSIVVAIGVAPVIPVLLATICRWSDFRLPRLFAGALFTVVGLFGLAVTLIFAVFAGGGTYMVLLHGVTLTLAVSASVLLIARDGNRVGFRRISYMLLMVPACAAVWSLASVPIAVWRANSIAHGDPMCVSEHHDGSYSPVSWLSQRAFSLYTTRSGYRDNDAWYFHRILQVKREADIEVFNWSFATMNFEPIMTPQRYLVKIVGVCVPRKDFWSSVAIL